jgi:hypothetical protein
MLKDPTGSISRQSVTCFERLPIDMPVRGLETLPSVRMALDVLQSLILIEQQRPGEDAFLAPAYGRAASTTQQSA